MRCTDRRRELQILTNGEVLVERVLLRHVADVLLQNVEVSVKGLSVEQDFAARRLELAGKHSHQRAFARTACAHHANKLSTRDAEGNSIEANFAFAKTVCDFVQLEAANDVSLLLDDALQKIASQNLSDIDSNDVAVLEKPLVDLLIVDVCAIGRIPVDQQDQIRIMISESLRGVISQQLIPRADGTGRVLAIETLTNTPAVSNVIREARTFMLPGIIQTGRKQGMQLMDDTLIDLRKQGLISAEEALALADEEHGLRPLHATGRGIRRHVEPRDLRPGSVGNEPRAPVDRASGDDRHRQSAFP